MSIGETDLSALLRALEPILYPETYVFCTTKQPLSSLPLATLQPELIFQESEGLTIITSKMAAESHGYQYTFPCRKISMKVHSSLEAVGLMAAISNKLAAEGLSSNVVSRYFHDHIFVPDGKEAAAMRALKELTNESI